MANAKLKVFEEDLLEEELEKDFELSVWEVPKIKAEERTSQWVHSNPLPTGKVSRSKRIHELLSMPEQIKLPLHPTPKERKSEKTDLLPELHILNPDLPQQQSTDEDRGVPQNTIFNRQLLISSTPLKDFTGSQLIDSLTVANQQIVAGLARQNLPKCQPDIFSGDELWEKLERHFGSIAVISNILLECLWDSATFDEGENDNLQQFRDLCADIESQVTYLLRLVGLNYANTMQPITVTLPQFIRAKWEKEIASYSNSNGGAYPSSRFSKIVQKQSKIKNDPNVLAGKAASPTQDLSHAKKTFKTETQPTAGKDSARG